MLYNVQYLVTLVLFVNVHNGQPKPNLRHKRKALSGLEVLLEIVGLEVMAEGVRAGTHSEGWRERIPDSRSCNANTTGAKQRISTAR